MKNSEIKEGDVFKIDTYQVDQYKDTRIVDFVTVEVAPSKNAKKVLVHIPYLQASHVVFIKDLKQTTEYKLVINLNVDIEKHLEVVDKIILEHFTGNQNFLALKKVSFEIQKEQERSRLEYKVQTKLTFLNEKLIMHNLFLSITREYLDAEDEAPVILILQHP